MTLLVVSMELLGNTCTMGALVSSVEVPTSDGTQATGVSIGFQLCWNLLTESKPYNPEGLNQPREPRNVKAFRMFLSRAARSLPN